MVSFTGDLYSSLLELCVSKMFYENRVFRGGDGNGNTVHLLTAGLRKIHYNIIYNDSVNFFFRNLVARAALMEEEKRTDTGQVNFYSNSGILNC